MLSIIVPTYNEKNNLSELTTRIKSQVKDAEVIVVDDNSPDGTADFARHLGVKVLVRPTRQGLASAVLDGFKIARGDILCVMDADLSHPPEIIPEMLDLIKSGQADLVVGSRLVKGGGSLDWTWYRKLASLIARLPARPLTTVRDNTSGYFMLKRSVIDGVALNPIGFKICLEVLAKGKYKKAVEVPIIFADRGAGSSKLGMIEATEYLFQLGLLYKDAVLGKLRKRG
ncbi:MAG TPA: polyprenol monophosphomannose synthase [Candidatus Omnitrophota bacterium]|nr:polyprenol monophosphomannose synthase [Candidatus Omnitrophota bacterium]